MEVLEVLEVLEEHGGLQRLIWISDDWSEHSKRRSWRSDFALTDIRRSDLHSVNGEGRRAVLRIGLRGCAQ